MPIILHFTFLVIAVALVFVPAYQEPFYTGIGLMIVIGGTFIQYSCTKYATTPRSVKQFDSLLINQSIIIQAITITDYLITRAQIIFNSRLMEHEISKKLDNKIHPVVNNVERF